MPTIRPLDDHVVVARLEAEEKTKGGIVLPDTAREKPSKGRVVAVGVGRLLGNGKRIPIDLKKGDNILFGKYAGSEVTVDGKEYLMMRESDILAKIE
ncbi:MAG: co-chaperone GroES [Candidatus Brocadiales bacterium]